MKFFDITHYNDENISGIRFVFLWIFSFSIMHNKKLGSHLNIAFGLKPLEVAAQFSIWSINGE